jgi:DNA invertase Pin-like site-specific DNA recombinase
MIALRCACYVRVSTASKSHQGDTTSFDQNPEVQEQPLRQLIAQRGWELYRVYSDRASGTKERRPGLDALMADARRGAFDVVVVWRFDRFARSVKQLVLALEEFRSLSVDFVSHQEALDTSTPLGKAMFTVIAAMAELERSVIRERVVAGLEYARQRGTRSGRPVGRPKAIFRRDQAPYLRTQGYSLREIARRLGSAWPACAGRARSQTRPCKGTKTFHTGFWHGVHELLRGGLSVGKMKASCHETFVSISAYSRRRSGSLLPTQPSRHSLKLLQGRSQLIRYHRCKLLRGRQVRAR